jgi:hypothetical protein
MPASEHPPEHWTPTSEEDRELVMKELDAILASYHFRGSKRYPAMLKYVVAAALGGHAGDLKERTLGVEVFGRDPNYDTSADPVVRFSASEVRKRIAQYYHENGSGARLQIELPLGSYMPEFVPRLPASTGTAPGVAPASQDSSAKYLTERPRLLRLGVAALAALVLFAAVFAALWYHKSTEKNSSVVDELWGPLLKSPGQVLFVVGPVLQEALTPRAENTGAIDNGIGRYDHVSVLSAVALTHLAGVLQRFGRSYEVKESTESSLADMRSRPVVLIGAVNNTWTMRRIASSFSSSGFSSFKSSALAPSDLALAGSSWTSRNSPSTPAATAARASSGMNSGCPPLTPPAAEGCCTECVPSNTTGASRRMTGSER